LFLSITLPATAVDVNVHPAKAEIRFLEKWPVERAIENAVRRALGTFDASATVGNRYYFQTSSLRPADYSPPPTDSVAVLAPAATDPGTLFNADAATYVPEVESQPAAAAVIPELFQFRRTYIAFEHDDGLVLIDQHSAHERVLYEEFMHSLETGKAPAQRLLLPLTLHLGPAEADAFEENREYLERLGFEVEGFGGSTLIVNTVPMPHRRFDAEKCLRETLDALTGDRVAGTATRHEHLAATVACKAAIKAGEQLSAPEMRALFAALRDTTLPAHDVHGRSTIVQLSWDELDRRFGRR
jgi:DNA mismatch repair protein MutL